MLFLALFLMLFQKMMGKKVSGPSVVVKKLIARSAAGDAEAMFELAKLMYWQYEDTVDGLQNAEQIFELLAAAGAAGDARLNRKIGNFCRREFREVSAQQYYRAAFEKELVCAAGQDTQAQYAVACHYAYAEGVAQSHEKAAFWCALAARGDHEEARRMLQNFDLERSGIQIPALAELETMKDDYFVTEAKREVAERKMHESYPQTIRVKDLSAPVHRRVVNGLANGLRVLLGVVSIAYLVLSLLSFIGVMACNYNAGDGSNWIADICYALLGVPLKLALQWDGYEAAQISAELLLQLYSFGFLGAIIVGALLVALWFVMIPILLFVKFKLVLVLLLWYVAIILAVILLQKLLSGLHTYGVAFKTTPCSDQERAGYKEQLAELEKKSEQAWKRLAEKYGNVKLPDTHGLQQTEGELALYFALRSVGANGNPLPAQEFAANGSFLNGYRQYRMGRDFNKAEELLADGAKREGAEAGWAAWYMAKLCREEKMPLYGFDEEGEKAKREAQKTAERMDEIAANRNCPKAVIDTANLQYLLWKRDPEALLSVGKQYVPVNTEVALVLLDAVGDAVTEMGQFGDPLRKAKWNDYDTGNVWACYEEFYARYKACTAEINEAWAISVSAAQHAEAKAKDALKALKDEAWGLTGKGLYRAEELYHWIEDGEASASRSAYQLQKQEEEIRQQREDAIAREMEKFDEKADSLERNMNAMFGNGFATNFERSLTGEMSQDNFLLSDELRHKVRENYRKEMEETYDQAHIHEEE